MCQSCTVSKILTLDLKQLSYFVFVMMSAIVIQKSLIIMWKRVTNVKINWIQKGFEELLGPMSFQII